jgi:IS30 family transposase
MNTSLTNEQLAQARILRREGKSFHAISKSVGRSYWTIRRALDPAARERRYQREWARREDRKSNPQDHARRPIIPPEVEADRDRRLSIQRSLTAEFFGDPPKGYSALDRRLNGAH